MHLDRRTIQERGDHGACQQGEDRGLLFQATQPHVCGYEPVLFFFEAQPAAFRPCVSTFYNSRMYTIFQVLLNLCLIIIFCYNM
jgi:hypothetical protein